MQIEKIHKVSDEYAKVVAICATIAQAKVGNIRITDANKEFPFYPNNEKLMIYDEKEGVSHVEFVSRGDYIPVYALIMGVYIINEKFIPKEIGINILGNIIPSDATKDYLGEIIDHAEEFIKSHDLSKIYKRYREQMEFMTGDEICTREALQEAARK